MAFKLGLKRIGLWLRTVRAPFLTATFAPIFIGAAVAWSDLKDNGIAENWSWKMFWLVLGGASLAQVATNASNDFFDHTSNADEINKVASPFNGGSRVIQVGLMTPGQVLITALVSIAGTVGIGLYLNQQVSGNFFGNTPILWTGIIGTFLALGYTGDPVRLGYKGFGEIAIALGFGPIMVMGAHYVLTAPIHNNVLGLWNWVEALIASVPIAILVMLIVWINQFQDAPSDAAVGKNTWVVRTAVNDGWMRLEKPLSLYKQFMVEAFLAVAAIGLLGMFTDYGTVYAFAALLPVLLVWKAFKMADEWMIKWNNPDADRQKVPYELLLVNVSTIGIHFLTGILISVAYIL
jgi:1,4-dihydroxy-2-naphthoate octaprenyltransferase